MNSHDFYKMTFFSQLHHHKQIFPRHRICLLNIVTKRLSPHYWAERKRKRVNEMQESNAFDLGPLKEVAKRVRAVTLLSLFLEDLQNHPKNVVAPPPT